MREALDFLRSMMLFFVLFGFYVCCIVKILVCHLLALLLYCTASVFSSCHSFAYPVPIVSFMGDRFEQIYMTFGKRFYFRLFSQIWIHVTDPSVPPLILLFYFSRFMKNSLYYSNRLWQQPSESILFCVRTVLTQLLLVKMSSFAVSREKNFKRYMCGEV